MHQSAGSAGAREEGRTRQRPPRAEAVHPLQLHLCSRRLQVRQQLQLLSPRGPPPPHEHVDECMLVAKQSLDHAPPLAPEKRRVVARLLLVLESRTLLFALPVGLLRLLAELREPQAVALGALAPRLGLQEPFAPADGLPVSARETALPLAAGVSAAATRTAQMQALQICLFLGGMQERRRLRLLPRPVSRSRLSIALRASVQLPRAAPQLRRQRPSLLLSREAGEARGGEAKQKARRDERRKHRSSQKANGDNRVWRPHEKNWRTKNS
ncbi:UNVERIFIED_CONTAM: hypothetical protein HHA_462760 [Hammondia hammondi]|eukprot:XP_008888535.1 hypothetical protein HHA_462760 [Hammondia hammondi]